MDEPILPDVLAGVLSDLLATLNRRFDETDARLQTLDRKVDTVHGLVRQVQREGVATHGTVQMLLDAHAMFRTEYLREHPGGGARGLTYASRAALACSGVVSGSTATRSDSDTCPVPFS